MDVVIFSDGSSRGNPGPGGWGGVVIIKHDDEKCSRVIELGGRENETTNNRMELTAALEGVRLVQSLGFTNATVYTDSSYLVNSLTKWIHGWVKNDWQTKENKHVLNRDILECFYDLLSLIEIKFKHIKGHSGIPLNERCDEIATAFADKKNVRLFDGMLSHYQISLSLQVNASNSKHKSSKVYSYVSEIDGIVKVHKTWNECKARVEGKKARFKKALSKEEEDYLIKDFSL